MWKDAFPKEKRYFETENGILFKGNALEVLPQLKGIADAVITDPPYVINYFTNYRQSNKEHRFRRPIANDDNRDLPKKIIPLVYDAMKENSALYMFGSWKTVDVFKVEIEKFFTLKNIIIWAKNNWTAGDLRGQYGQSYELIYYATKGIAELMGKRYPDVWRFGRVSNRKLVHQNQKPLGLIEFIIENSTKPGDIIVDPFLGSGTTAVAAERLGRKWIGIEIEEDFCRLVVERFNNIQLRLL